jgi:hypothetical protein
MNILGGLFLTHQLKKQKESVNLYAFLLTKILRWISDYSRRKTCRDSHRLLSDYYCIKSRFRINNKTKRHFLFCFNLFNFKLLQNQNFNSKKCSNSSFQFSSWPALVQSCFLFKLLSSERFYNQILFQPSRMLLLKYK